MVRYKGSSTNDSFAISIKDENLIIKTFVMRKKVDESKLNIAEYLSQDTEWDRRMYIYQQDISDVKSEKINVCVAERNLDAIHHGVNETLKEAGLFKPTFADMIKR